MKQMTNEYAKQVLERYYMLFNEEFKQALDVAIKALEIKNENTEVKQ